MPKSLSSTFLQGSTSELTVPIANINSSGFKGVITFTHKISTTELDLNFQSLPEITEECTYAWNIHTNPIDSTGRCNSNGFHLDLTKLSSNESNPNHKCDPNNVATMCDVGNLSVEFGKLLTDQKAYQVLDSTLHLNRENVITERSIVIHLANNTRIACTNTRVTFSPRKCGY